MPDDRTIVVERFRDEIGDWRVAVLSPFGGQVHAPWALCVAARMRERFGVDVQAMHGDDGIVFRLPDLEFDEGERGSGGVGGEIGRQLVELVTLEPEDVAELVTQEIGGSALFAARFRECAARALLLPRVARTAASRCGSSASGPRSCSRWRASTRPSPSSSRRSASASRTSSTCPGSSS